MTIKKSKLNSAIMAKCVVHKLIHKKIIKEVH